MAAAACAGGRRSERRTREREPRYAPETGGGTQFFETCFSRRVFRDVDFRRVGFILVVPVVSTYAPYSDTTAY